MSSNESSRSKFEQLSKMILNHPNLSAVGMFSLLSLVFIAAFVIQYNEIQSLADASRSQIDTIKREYARFEDGKTAYSSFVADVSEKLRSDSPELDDFQALYIKSVATDISALANTAVFQEGLWLDEGITALLSSKMSTLQALFSKLPENRTDLRESVLRAFGDVAMQQVVHRTYVAEKVANYDWRAKEYQLEYLQLYHTKATEKLRLMTNALLFLGKKAPFNDEILQDACSYTLAHRDIEYVRKDEGEGAQEFKKLYKELLHAAFVFYLVKTPMSNSGELLSDDSNIFLHVFGSDSFGFSSKKALEESIADLSKLGSVEERVAYYNRNVQKIWFSDLSSPSLDLARIDEKYYTPAAE